MVEQDITSSSRPYLRVELGPRETKKSNPMYIVSTIQSQTGAYDNPDGSAVIMNAEIGGIVPTGRKGNITFKDVTGVWPKRLTDVGRAGSSLMNTSSINIIIKWGWTGLKKSRKAYNNDGLGNAHITEITGFMEAVKFDVLEDGVVTVSIDFIQFTDVVTMNMLSMSFDDVRSDKRLDETWDELEKVCGKGAPPAAASTSNANAGSGVNTVSAASMQVSTTSSSSGTEPTAIDVINYMLAVPGWKYPNIGAQGVSPTSFGKQLAAKKVIIQAGSNYYPWHANPLKGDNDLLSLPLNMPLGQWLNEMLDKVVLDEEGSKIVEKGLLITFERKNDKPAEIMTNDSRFKGWTVITYDWNAVIDITNPDIDKERLEQRYGQYIKDLGSKETFVTGPLLFWKSDANNQSIEINTEERKTYDYDGTQLGVSQISNKRILNWTSDLNSKAHLFRQFENEIRNKLETITAKPEFGKFEKEMGRYDAEELDGISNAAESGFGNRARIMRESGLNGPDAFFRSIGMLLKPGKYEDIVEAYTETKKVVDEYQMSVMSGASTGRNQTLASIVARNVLKMNVDIIGDPDIGTIFQGGNTLINTNFSYSDDGYFRHVYDINGRKIAIDTSELIVGMFTREWILQESSHKLNDDGTYITSLTLLGPPKMNMSDTELSASNASMSSASGGAVALNAKNTVPTTKDANGNIIGL